MKLLTTQLIHKDIAKHHVVYGKYLTNHLMYVLIAFDRLGCSEVEIQTFYDHYVQRLEPAATIKGEPINDWRPLVGNADKYAELKAYFNQMSGSELSIALRQVIEANAHSIGAAAFHGLNHIGWAIRSKDSVVLGAACGYFVSVCSFHIVLSPNPSYSAGDLFPIIVNICGDDSLNNFKGDASFASGMKRLATCETDISCYDVFLSVSDIDDAISKTEQLLDQLWGLFYRTGGLHFFLLHCVTGCDSLIQIINKLSHDCRIDSNLLRIVEDLVKFFFRFVVMAYIVLGRPKLIKGYAYMQVEKQEFENSVAEAVKSGDEHLIKLAVLATERPIYRHIFADTVSKVIKRGFVF
jgi:hypothetical protein